METINIFLVIFSFILVLCTIGIIVSDNDITYENNIPNDIDNTTLSITQKEVFEDLDNIINIYIANFIYENKLAGGEIYFNSDRLNEAAVKLSTTILSDMSYHFKRKIGLFITSHALYTYVTKTVIRQMLAYAAQVNRPK